jgi:hypothetical protein
MKDGNSKEHIENELSMKACKYALIMRYFLFSDIQFWSE